VEACRLLGRLHGKIQRGGTEFLRCGPLEHGFARLWCSECRRSVLVAFSCRGRSFCPSCERKHQILWAEWLCEDVLAKVAQRHVVLIERGRRGHGAATVPALRVSAADLIAQTLGDDGLAAMSPASTSARSYPTGACRSRPNARLSKTVPHSRVFR
jgi:hypothetical protein